MDRTLVAKRIRMARAGARLSLEAMAHEVSKRLPKPVSRDLIRRIEDEERDVELGLLAAMADATGEPLDWLMGREAMSASSNVDGATGRQLQPPRRLRINPSKSGFGLRPVVA